MNKELIEIKEIIQKEVEKAGLKVEKIILFGSRARGDFKEDSDWDIMVTLDSEFTREKRRHLLGEIYKRLAKFENSYEIVLKKKAEFERMKEVIGSLSYDTNKEGILL